MLARLRFALFPAVFERVSPSARKVECPALVFYGSRGQMAKLFDIPAEWRKRLASITETSLPGGHFFVDQFPRETAEILLTFVVTKKWPPGRDVSATPSETFVLFRRDIGRLPRSARKVECPALVFYGSRGQMAKLFDIPAEWRKRLASITETSLPGGHFFVDQFPRLERAEFRLSRAETGPTKGYHPAAGRRFGDASRGTFACLLAYSKSFAMPARAVENPVPGASTLRAISAVSRPPNQRLCPPGSRSKSRYL